MTWFTLECVDANEVDATKPALICLEDVSAVGPEQKRETYQTPMQKAGVLETPSWQLEYVSIVSLRNGQAFVVRPAEAARLKAELVDGTALCKFYWTGTSSDDKPVLRQCSLKENHPGWHQTTDGYNFP